jgi:hypothetical protein
VKSTIGLEWYGESGEAKRRIFSGILDQALGKGVGEAIFGKGWTRRPWVAEITGPDERFGFSRRFLESKLSRTNANGSHTRGVDLWFVLDSGRVYEVKHSVSWTRSDRYFCTVTDSGDIKRITKSEVEQWLNDRSE